MFLAVALVDEKALAKVFPLPGSKAFETVEIGIVVIRDDMFHQPVFRLRDRTLRPFPDEQDQVLQEPCLLHVHLFPADAERVHGDGFFLGVADVFPTEVFAKSLIGVSRVHHHHIRSLLMQLSDHTVHVE